MSRGTGAAGPSSVCGALTTGTVDEPFLVIDSSDDEATPTKHATHTTPRRVVNNGSDSDDSLPDAQDILSGKNDRVGLKGKLSVSPSKRAAGSSNALLNGLHGNAAGPTSHPQTKKRKRLPSSSPSSSSSILISRRIVPDDIIDLTLLDTDYEGNSSPEPGTITPKPSSPTHQAKRPKQWLAKKTVGMGVARRIASRTTFGVDAKEVWFEREDSPQSTNGIAATPSESETMIPASDDEVLDSVDPMASDPDVARANNLDRDGTPEEAFHPNNTINFGRSPPDTSRLLRNPSVDADVDNTIDSDRYDSPEASNHLRVPPATKSDPCKERGKKKRPIASEMFDTDSSEVDAEAEANVERQIKVAKGALAGLSGLSGGLGTEQPDGTTGRQNPIEQSWTKPTFSPVASELLLDEVPETDAEESDDQASFAREVLGSNGLTRVAITHGQHCGSSLPSPSIDLETAAKSRRATANPQTPSESPPAIPSPPASTSQTPRSTRTISGLQPTLHDDVLQETLIFNAQRQQPTMPTITRDVSPAASASQKASVAMIRELKLLMSHNETPGHQEPAARLRGLGGRFARSSSARTSSKVTSSNSSASIAGGMFEFQTSHLPSPAQSATGSTPPGMLRSNTPMGKVPTVVVSIPATRDPKNSTLSKFLGGVSLSEWRARRIAEKLQESRNIVVKAEPISPTREAVKAKQRAALLQEEIIMNEALKGISKRESWTSSTNVADFAYTPSTTEFVGAPEGPAKQFDTTLHDRVNAIPENERSWALLKAVFETYMDEINCVDDPDAAPITIVNEVDADPRPPPFEFQYSNHMLYTHGVEKAVPSAGCGCTGRCDPNSKTCLCARRQSLYLRGLATGFCYMDGRLRPIDDMSIWECSDACGCPPSCGNRVIQRGRGPNSNLQLFKTVNKGWGVRNGSSTIIAPGTFVGIYSGELLSEDESEQRAHAYNSVGRTYLFDLDGYQIAYPPVGLEKVDPQLAKLARKTEWEAKAWYKGTDMTEGYSKHSLDAFHWGNISRFYNHSCDPNVVTVQAYVKDFHPNRPILALFARRRIAPNEELCISYHGVANDDEEDEDNKRTRKQAKSRSQNAHVAVPRGGRSRAAEAERTLSIKDECRCGSRKCAGYLFSVNKE